jgi:hypothetical protein
MRAHGNHCVICSDRLFEADGTTLALAQLHERVAEVVLGQGPIQRHALTGCFGQRRAIGGDRLLKMVGAALALLLLTQVSRTAFGAGPRRLANFGLTLCWC